MCIDQSRLVARKNFACNPKVSMILPEPIHTSISISSPPPLTASCIMSACKTLVRICSKQRQQSTLLPFIQCRHESTARRHRKLLTVKEAPSYTADSSAPTLIYNPPSSAPSVYHTPLKFLPKHDKRRQMYTANLITSTQAAYRKGLSHTAAPGTPLTTSSQIPPRPSAPLPPALRQPYEKKYHLTEKEIEEIRTLRLSDPNKWTRVKLAEKFGCSQFFVGMVVKAPEKAESVAKEHEAARAKWGLRRRTAREDRERRKILWGQDA